jgi:hypothetical protein
MHISKSVQASVFFAILSVIGALGLLASHQVLAWFGGVLYGAGTLALLLLWAAPDRR